jgi:hypothetical protein
MSRFIGVKPTSQSRSPESEEDPFSDIAFLFKHREHCAAACGFRVLRQSAIIHADLLSSREGSDYTEC